MVAEHCRRTVDKLEKSPLQRVSPQIGNIAQVFDFGEVEGDWYLAMELVDGQPLSKVVKRMRATGLLTFPSEIASYVTAEMLRGLHYAHTRLDEQGRPLQIVHRDVSPQNVLVSYEGQIKLVDFGIARARNAGREDTTSNAVKGKYAYFAPEQARGKDLDARTDVFASGIVLYELLTGQLPFQGRMMEVLTKIVRGQFARPSELNPAIPKALETIVLKAMALEASERYQTAEAFQQDLNRYLANHHPDFTASMLTLLLQLPLRRRPGAGWTPRAAAPRVRGARAEVEGAAARPGGAREQRRLGGAHRDGGAQRSQSAAGHRPPRRRAAPSLRASRGACRWCCSPPRALVGYGAGPPSPSGCASRPWRSPASRRARRSCSTVER